MPGWRELFSHGLGRTTIGLLLMETMVAIQVLVTVAVLPAVVSDLGGIRLYGVALAASQVATVVVLPFTGRLVGRWGLRSVFYASVCAFVAGSAVMFTAPVISVFVGGILIQGAGGGAMYALLLAILTRRFALRLRPRIYAALAIAWAVPGLLGPLYGGFVASTLGWRWAFALILPIVIPAVWMLRPSLRNPDVGRDSPDGQLDQTARTLTLVVFGVSAVLLLAALAIGGWWGLLVSVPAAVLGIGALRSILPAGSFRADRGLPAVIASGFLANASFYSVEGFLPAFLTAVAAMPLVAADLVVTCGVLAWVAGSWIQSRLAARWVLRRIAKVGEALMLAGVGGVLTGVLTTWSPLVYLSWAFVGLGMGMTYPVIGVLATDLATPGKEVVTLAQYQLADVLGSAVGPGLVGFAVIAVTVRGLDLRGGLIIGFSATCLLLLVGLVVSTRLPATHARGTRNEL